jgi:hypothetical protein
LKTCIVFTQENGLTPLFGLMEIKWFDPRADIFKHIQTINIDNRFIYKTMVIIFTVAHINKYNITFI